ncbi:endothelin-converting enzyme 1-like [Drosophila miranda]|uniref:endothelin-converting enzyme 1-like n=1 Tax=Drosophila miranda TaxID=7229 RepID=UPI00143F483A|nr:endothelin-converting enzyme 1-like [Drosophila miranda]
MRALLPLGMNYLYKRYVYRHRDLLDTKQLLLIFDSLKIICEWGIFQRSHYESANFSDSLFLGNILEALSLRTRLQHDALRLPHSRLDLHLYYVNDDVVKARTSPFYENERNTITVPLIFLQWPLFDSRQHHIFQFSLMGGVLAHELTHAFEQEGILFDADGNESPVGLQIRETKVFQNAIKCAARTPAVSLKERLADLNGLQLAYDTFFGPNHNSQNFEYRPYAFESEFKAPQLFHLSYAQFFCGILPPVLGHDRDDVRVNLSVGNLRKFSLDFKCPPPAVQSPPVCELWRPK